MRAALVLCPGWYVFAPALGPALLKAYLRERGHEIEAIDLGPAWVKSFPPDVFERLRASDCSTLEDAALVRRLMAERPELVEASIQRILARDPEVVGFTAYSSTWEFSAAFAAELKRRRPGIAVIVGGPQGTRYLAGADLERDTPVILKDVDAIVPGEGELPLARLLAGWRDGAFSPAPGAFVRRDGRFVWGGEAEQIADLDALPFPDFSGFSAGDYFDRGELVTYFSRGCIKKCVFCDVEVNWKGWRNRSGERVMAELEHQLARFPDTTHFIFCDSIMNADMKALGRFCDLMIARGPGRVRWRGYAVARGDMTPEFCRKLHAAGCRELMIGVESGSQRVLDAMKKGCRTATAAATLKAAHEAGVRVAALFMAGFPTETEADFEETLDFVRRNGRYMTALWPSESFTYIANTTYLDRHAFDVFGVDPRGFHPVYWRSQGGRNDYPERVSRYARLCAAAREAGVPNCPTREQVESSRPRLLAGYERFLADQRSPDSRDSELLASS